MQQLIGLFSAFPYASLGLLLTAIVTGILGTFVVVRRMSFIAGGITHSSFAGLGLGFYLGVSPIGLAIVSAVISGLGVEYLTRGKTVRADSAVAAIWSLGMALGVLFTFLTPGYSPGLSAFLFGNILLVSQTDLLLLALYLVATLLPLYRWYYPLLFISYDEEYGRTRKLPVQTVRICMMAWFCVGIVLSIRALGIMMLMSMLTLPQMICNLYTSRFKHILVGSCLVSICAGILGLTLSFYLNLPTGACSVLLLAMVFLASKAERTLRRNHEPPMV